MSDEQGRPGSAGGELRHYAFSTTGQNAHVVGLFRVRKNDHDETLTLARFTPDGTWVDDPSLIDDLHDPTVKEIPEHEAHELEQQIAPVGAPANEPPADDWSGVGPLGLSNGIAIPYFAQDRPERWADAVDFALQLSARHEPDGHPHMPMVLAMARVAFNDPGFPPQPRRTLIQRLLGRAR